ncbi:MAG: hypothetical protein KTR15_01160 [Phycisphaeraceae bacterium]|nr:hypothetical protein [Phycisphaeraceae bacterium]
MIYKTTTAIAGAALFASSTAIAGYSHEIDLSSYDHGAIVDGMNLNGVTVSGDNFHNNADHVVVFDTTKTGTRDSDLQGANGNGGEWKRGNLKGTGNVIGNILILQELDHNFAGYTDGSQTAVQRPDDEGRRSGGTSPGAGELYFSFDKPVDSFGFTLIDVEKTGEFNNETGFFATFYGGGQSTKVSFADLIDKDSVFYDPTIKFGNNSANRVAALKAPQLGMNKIERVTINLGGSGGVGDVRVTGVPTPTAAIAGLAVMGVLLGRRGNRQRG